MYNKGLWSHIARLQRDMGGIMIAMILKPNALLGIGFQSFAVAFGVGVLTMSLGLGPAAAQNFNEYPTVTPFGNPYSITAGPDGALWFTENYGRKIGRITTA